MILASQEFIEELYSDSQDYYKDTYLDFYHSLGETLDEHATPFATVGREELKEGGIIIESTACSEDGFPMGKCIMRKLTLNLIGEIRTSEWELIDFTGTWVVVNFLVDGYYQLFGRFMIDSQDYDGDDLVLVGYDTVSLLDAPFTGVAAPTNAYSLLRAIEPMVGWTSQEELFIISGDEQDFRSVTYSSVPKSGDMTCREVVECVLQTLGCNLHEYVHRNYPYSTGFVIDFPQLSTIAGETPTDEYTAQEHNYDLFRYIYSLDLSKQDIEISGATVVYNDPTAADLVNTVTVSQTTPTAPNFKIRIEGNPLISTAAEATACANRVSGYYALTKYRKANFTHVEDPRIVAGDMGKVLGRDGEYHDIILAHTKYQIQNKQQSYSGAPDTHRNKVQGYSTRTSTVNEAYNYSKVHSDANASAIDSLETTVNSHTNALSAIGTVKRANLASTTSIPDATATTLCNVSLTAGTWVIIGKVTYQGGSAGTYRQARLGTTATGNEYGLVQFDAATNNRSAMIGYIAELTAARTVYLNTQHGNNSATNVAGGATNTFIQAVRIK